MSHLLHQQKKKDIFVVIVGGGGDLLSIVALYDGLDGAP